MTQLQEIEKKKSNTNTFNQKTLFNCKAYQRIKEEMILGFGGNVREQKGGKGKKRIFSYLENSILHSKQDNQRNYQEALY